MLHMGPFENRVRAPEVAAPETSLPEFVSEVGVGQLLQQANESVESPYCLRVDFVRESKSV
jgi:hypothetical protein